jgi:hypothetical protein
MSSLDFLLFLFSFDSLFFPKDGKPTLPWAWTASHLRFQHAGQTPVAGAGHLRTGSGQICALHKSDSVSRDQRARRRAHDGLLAGLSGASRPGCHSVAFYHQWTGKLDQNTEKNVRTALGPRKAMLSNPQPSAPLPTSIGSVPGKAPGPMSSAQLEVRGSRFPAKCHAKLRGQGAFSPARPAQRAVPGDSRTRVGGR